MDQATMQNDGGMTDSNKTIPPPPILGSWRNLYAAVLGALAAEIALFYLFTRMFA